MEGRTTIALSARTRQRLRGVGRKGETYDELVNRLIDVYQGQTVEFEPVE